MVEWYLPAGKKQHFVCILSPFNEECLKNKISLIATLIYWNITVPVDIFAYTPFIIEFPLIETVKGILRVNWSFHEII